MKKPLWADLGFGDVLRYPHSGATIMFLRWPRPGEGQIEWWAILLDRGRGLGRNLEPGDLVYFTCGMSGWVRIDD